MISFIVLAGGAGPALGRTLAGVGSTVRSLSEDCELIVVDAGGDESIAGLASSARSHGLGVIQFVLDPGGAPHDAGAAASKGETLLFVAGGAEVTARAVRAAVRALREGAIGGEAMPIKTGGLSRLARLARVLRRRLAGAYTAPASPLLFCTRSAYERSAAEAQAAGENAMRARLARQGRFVQIREQLAC